MSHNNNKKLPKFLASRRSKKQGRSNGDSGLLALDIVCALLPPVILGITYSALLYFDVFSIIYLTFHWMGIAALFIWLILALIKIQSYWPSKLTYFFPILFLLLTLFGSCWGYADSSIKIWAVPPAYTNMPSSLPIQITRIDYQESLEGSHINLSWAENEPAFQAHFIGDGGTAIATEKAETFSIIVPHFDKPTHKKLVIRRGLARLAQINVLVKPDTPPTIKFKEDIEVTSKKSVRFSYKAADDYGVEQVFVRVAPSSSFTGGNTEPVEVIVSTPGIKELESSSYVDLSFLEWSGLPVTIQIIAVDGRQQRGWSEPHIVTLPLRSFQNPFARTLIEEREKLNTEPIALVKEETANVMAGVARQQSLYHGDPLVVLALRSGAVRLILDASESSLKATSALLWSVAVRLEDGEAGKRRTAFLEASSSFQYALLRGYTKENIKPFLVQLKNVTQKYMEAFGREPQQQTPLVYKNDFPIGAFGDFIETEEIGKRFSLLEKQVETNDTGGAQTSLQNIQHALEKVSILSPNYTPEQMKVLQKVSSLKALVKRLKDLNEKIGGLLLEETSRVTAIQKNGTSLIDQQQTITSALREFITHKQLEPIDIGDCESLLVRAQQELKKNKNTEAHKINEETINLLEKQLHDYKEIMSRAVASKAR